MVAHAARLAFLIVVLPSCTQRWTSDDPATGSTVVYEPAPRDAPGAPPARLPSAPAFIEPPRSTHAVEVRSGQSVVRYEPILDHPVVAHTSRHAPIEDEPELDHHQHDGHDLPLEDRPDTPRPPPSTSKRGLHGPVDASIYGVHLTPDGLALPYPTAHVFRGFGACRGKRHHHEAIDLGGVGPDWGVGTPIRSMADAEVIFIGSGEVDPDDFGTPDKRGGHALRGDRKLPRSKVIPPYGRVYFFTKKKGRWRSGNLIVTRVLDGPLAGHTIRYLHVAAIHPDVRVGTTVARGQEIALMGGTGVQESAPHLHLDIQAPDGKRLDVAPLLGLPPTASCRPDDDDDDGDERDDEPPTRVAATPERSRLTEPPPKTTTPDAPAPSAPVPPGAYLMRDLVLARCKTTTHHEDFGSGRYSAHAAELTLKKGDKLTVELARKAGTWKPRLQLAGEGATVKTLASGKLGAKAALSITATDDTTVALEIGGWDDTPPTDAAYALKIHERCRTPR